MKVSKGNRMCLRFASCSFSLTSSILRLLTCYSSGCIISAGCFRSDSLELPFIMLSVSSRISHTFVISYSIFLVTLSLSSVIYCSPYDSWSTFNCTLSPSYSDPSGVWWFSSCRSSILRYMRESPSIKGCSENCIMRDVKYYLIAPHWPMAIILNRSSQCTVVNGQSNSAKRLLAIFSNHANKYSPG